jgi:alkaline phosphatase D
MASQLEAVDGVWDDHDYGVNDGGGDTLSAHVKAANQNLFLDFLGVSQRSHRRTRTGLWSTRTFGQPGRQVRVIFLDTRSARAPHYIPSVAAAPRLRQWIPFAAMVAACVRLGSTLLGVGQGYAGDMLGSEQWEWLETTLTTSVADVTVVRKCKARKSVAPERYQTPLWRLLGRGGP